MLAVSNNITYNELVRIVQELAQKVDNLERRTSSNAGGWNGGVTNLTQNKSFDADATSVSELADTLGTLIGDLLEAEIIS